MNDLKHNLALVSALKAVLCFELDNVRWMAENTCDELKKAATLIRITDLLVHLEECRKAQGNSSQSKTELVTGAKAGPFLMGDVSNGGNGFHDE